MGAKDHERLISNWCTLRMCIVTFAIWLAGRTFLNGSSYSLVDDPYSGLWSELIR